VIGEALGYEEAKQSKPFVGPAGQFLWRNWGRVGSKREEVSVANVVTCQPKNDWLVGAPWEGEAIARCEVHRNVAYGTNPDVILCLGTTALKTVTREILGYEVFGPMENWHGRVITGMQGTISTPADPLVIATWHPSFLLRGNKNLTGVFLWALNLAKRVAREGYAHDWPTLVVDPPVEWFSQWCDLVDDECWLAVDIETPGRGSDQLAPENDSSYEITRVNLAVSADQGITVPFTGPYIPLITGVLEKLCTKLIWYAPFDVPRLLKAGCAINGAIFDPSDAWHLVQSDVSKGDGEGSVKGNSLGFVSAFYSNLPPWKHESKLDPGYYAALDGVQTWRCMNGIAQQLVKDDQWEIFIRHCVEIDRLCLRPMTRIGLQIDRPQLELFTERLRRRENELIEKMRDLVPREAQPLFPAQGWKRKPTKFGPDEEIIEKGEGAARRYYVRADFNPRSPDQIRAYIVERGLRTKVNKKSKTKKPSTEENELKRLAKKDPFFADVLAMREIGKVRGTYGDGILQRLDEADRVHGEFTKRPSTQRFSSRDPNLQNIVGDRDPTSIAWGFRRTVVAAPGCKLVELDYASIEGVQTGWWAADPTLIRLGKLGLHNYVLTHIMARRGKFRAADLSWSEDDQRTCYKEAKKLYSIEYDKTKRCVYQTLYGGTAYGIAAIYPDDYTIKTAGETQDILFELCPAVKTRMDKARALATKQNYLGGPTHPYRYRHWFWDVVTWDSRTQDFKPGDDWNRVAAYDPQSSAAGNIKEAMLEIMDPSSETYVGDMWYGQNPLRATIHDSLLGEVEDRYVDEFLGRVALAMRRPIEEQPLDPSWGLGNCLVIGVAAKVGQNWLQRHEALNPDGMEEVSV
jgi:uracil-DNA glycosylase family 4